MCQIFGSLLILCVGFVTYTVIHCSAKQVRNSAILISGILQLCGLGSVGWKERTYGSLSPLG